MQPGDPRCPCCFHIHIGITFRDRIIRCPCNFKFSHIFQRNIENPENLIDRLKRCPRKKFHGILDILHIFHDKIPEALTLCRVFRLRSGDLILCFHIWFKIFFSEHGRPAFAFFIDLCRAGPSLCHYCPTHSPDTYNCHITTPLHIAFRNPQENFLIRLNLLLRTPFFRHQYQQHSPRNPGKNTDKLGS